MNKAPLRLLRVVLVMLLSFTAAFAALHFGRRSEWYKDHLYARLMAAESSERMRAASLLAQVGGEAQLLRALQTEDTSVHELARRALEHLWFNSAGREAYEELEVAYRAAEREEYKDALQILDRLVIRYPSYAEAWNRRAAVLWQMGQYEKSLRDCERTLDLNPNHYGAWQGLGVCQLHLGEIQEACRSLRLSLKIAPHDEAARRSLEKCEELLRLTPTRHETEHATELM